MTENTTKIGNIEIDGKTALAPLAGVTDISFRMICKELGAPVVFSEMVSSEGLVRGSEKTNRYLNFLEEERPVALQVFGSDPGTMAEAAKIVEERNPDIIDVNFGCPVKKVVRNNAGSALLKDPERMGRIVKEMVKSVKIPVTAKIRSGWDESSLPVTEIGKILEDAGASAITLHARTQKMKFSGSAVWEDIRLLKDAVSIPVIGNGDVKTPSDALKMIEATGCDLIMIGRGTMGNPWIFRECNHYLLTNELLPRPSDVERVKTCLKQLNYSILYYGERYAKNTMKKHIGWYLKGLPESAKAKSSVFLSQSADEILEILNNYREFLVDSYDNGDTIINKEAV